MTKRIITVIDNILVNRNSQVHHNIKKKRGGLWPYHPEHACSHLILKAKQGWAFFILGWETPGNTRCCCRLKKKGGGGGERKKIGKTLFVIEESQLTEDTIKQKITIFQNLH